MRKLRWCSFSLLGLAGLALLADVARTQPQLGNGPALKSAFNKADVRRAEISATGSTTKLTAADKKYADDIAKYFLYRITHANSFEPAKVQAEFASYVAGTEKKNSTVYQDFLDNYLAPALVSNMKTVLEIDVKENPGVYVNACAMLPTMARLRSPAIGEYLTSLAEPSQPNDIARLNALRGLREFMPVRVFDPTSDDGVPDREKRRARDIKHVNSLTKFIERPVKVQGLHKTQAAVVHFFRQEAIASLAQAGAPAVQLTKKGSVLEGPIAPTLLKVLADDLEPQPNLQEKIEAAVGVCSIKFASVPDYRPELAAYLVGRTLNDAVKEYNKDLLGFSTKGKDQKQPYYAWKAEGARLEASIKELKENTRTTAAAKSVHELESTSKDILKAMKSYKELPQDRVFELNKMVPLMKPKDGAVFKGLKTPVIDLSK